MPRVRKSDTEKKAQGTLQRCRIPKIPVSFSEKKLSAEPPKGLRQDAKDAWAMAIECSPYPLVAIDLSVLERWARNYAMYRRLAREVEDESIVCELDPTKLNPKFNAMVKIQQVLANCEKELGFTPVSRARVRAPEKEEDTENVFESL